MHMQNCPAQRLPIFGKKFGKLPIDKPEDLSADAFRSLKFTTVRGWSLASSFTLSPTQERIGGGGRVSH